MKKTNFTKSLKFGFTLVEILITISIIGILSAIGITMFSGGKAKGADAKILAQLGQMTAQGFLYSGAMPSIDFVVGPVNTGIVGAPTGTSPAQLFNATNLSLNSLYALGNTLPKGTYIYYGWDGDNPNLTGKWFFAASTSTGAFCNDNRGSKKSYTGTAISSNPTAVNSWTGVFPGATVAGGYRCN